MNVSPDMPLKDNNTHSAAPARPIRVEDIHMAPMSRMWHMQRELITPHHKAEFSLIKCCRLPWLWLNQSKSYSAVCVYVRECA